MTVPSPAFLLFAAVAALAFNLGPAAPWWRQGVLLAVNITFLVSFSHAPLAFLPLAGFLALGFAVQRLTREATAPRLFLALLALTLAAFFWLKRYSFVPNFAFLPYPYVLVGLSYVFFRVLHLIIDSHQGTLGTRIGLVSYLNYTLNFTSLVAGPIQRYQDYRRMETAPPPLDLPASGAAAERIVIGTFKVVIVSMLLALAQQRAIDSLGADLPLMARVAAGIRIAAIYPVYLYFNFSGYTDVVIGVARFFRIVLPENFDRPFAAENFLLFWSRWHITLSRWLKTYVYNPLMKAAVTRVGDPGRVPYCSVAAFFVTFFLVGLWHGQSSEFLVFGFLQGAGVAANQLYQVLMQQRLGRPRYRALAANPVYRACTRGLTFTWFAFTLLWFWSRWAQIGGLAQALGPQGLALTWLAIFAGATIGLAAISSLGAAADQGAGLLRSRYVRTARGTAVAMITAAVLLLLQTPAPDIVYKTF